MGNTVGETTVDDKWRITLPPDVREGIRKGEVLLVDRKDGRLFIRPRVDIERFERELKGCVKGSKMPADRLKEIWGIHHAHD